MTTYRIVETAEGMYYVQEKGFFGLSWHPKAVYPSLALAKLYLDTLEEIYARRRNPVVLDERVIG